MNHPILNCLDAKPYLTDSGLETTLIFQEGIDLPHFASFVLLETEAGRQRLQDYYVTHIELARNRKAGFILETPTWRANPDWAEKLHLTLDDLARLNRLAVAELARLRSAYPDTPMLLSGCIGPRSDGYQPAFRMDASTAEQYHQFQVDCFARSDVDMVSAMTLCYVDEAIGITRAAQHAGLPVVISFTVETDGCLIDGTSIEQAIRLTDNATDNGPLYYMINCAHPTHFDSALAGDAWLHRIRGVRANSSCKSHAELNYSTELDAGDPHELGQQYAALQSRLARLAVFGGCCGTDHRHIHAIAHACL